MFRVCSSWATAAPGGQRRELVALTAEQDDLLGIRLEGVGANFSPIPVPSITLSQQVDTDGGLRLLRGVARLGANDDALDAFHDVPAELAEFDTQDWHQGDRVPKAGLLPAVTCSGG